MNRTLLCTLVLSSLQPPSATAHILSLYRTNVQKSKVASKQLVTPPMTPNSPCGRSQQRSVEIVIVMLEREKVSCTNNFENKICISNKTRKKNKKKRKEKKTHPAHAGASKHGEAKRRRRARPEIRYRESFWVRSSPRVVTSGQGSTWPRMTMTITTRFLGPPRFEFLLACRAQ